MQDPASLTVRYVSRPAARSARRHLFVPIPKGSTWMPVRPRGRVSSSAGIAGPLTRRKRRLLVGVMTLAFQGYAIATTAAYGFEIDNHLSVSPLRLNYRTSDA